MCNTQTEDNKPGELLIIVGHIARTAMKSWGIQPREAAARTGKSVGYIAYVLRGERNSLMVMRTILEMIEERAAEYERIGQRLQELADGPMG